MAPSCLHTGTLDLLEPDDATRILSIGRTTLATFYGSLGKQENVAAFPTKVSCFVGLLQKVRDLLIQTYTTVEHFFCIFFIATGRMPNEQGSEGDTK